MKIPLSLAKPPSSQYNAPNDEESKIKLFKKLASMT